MLDFNLITYAVEYGWRGYYINPKKMGEYIEQNSCDRRYKVKWKALTQNSGIFTYMGETYWFYRKYDGTCDVERM